MRHRHADITVSVIQELMRRDSLHAALAGRDEKSLEIIMRFIAKYVPPIYLNIAAFSDKNHLNARNLFAVMAGVLIA